VSNFRGWGDTLAMSVVAYAAGLAVEMGLAVATDLRRSTLYAAVTPVALLFYAALVAVDDHRRSARRDDQ
jgi:hypothetical protein